MKQSIIKRIDNDDMKIDCPNCDNWECQPIDEQRHHLQSFHVLEWVATKLTEHEKSTMLCLECKKEFIAVWAYLNQLSC